MFLFAKIQSAVTPIKTWEMATKWYYLCNETINGWFRSNKYTSIAQKTEANIDTLLHHPNDRWELEELLNPKRQKWTKQSPKGTMLAEEWDQHATTRLFHHFFHAQYAHYGNCITFYLHRISDARMAKCENMSGDNEIRNAWLAESIPSLQSCLSIMISSYFWTETSKN